MTYDKATRTLHLTEDEQAYITLAALTFGPDAVTRTAELIALSNNSYYPAAMRYWKFVTDNFQVDVIKYHNAEWDRIGHKIWDAFFGEEYAKTLDAKS